MSFLYANVCVSSCQHAEKREPDSAKLLLNSHDLHMCVYLFYPCRIDHSFLKCLEWKIKKACNLLTSRGLDWQRPKVDMHHPLYLDLSLLSQQMFVVHIHLFRYIIKMVICYLYIIISVIKIPSVIGASCFSLCVSDYLKSV